MKKIALIIAIISLNLSQLRAQDTGETPVRQESQKLRMGLSVSPLISWFSADGDAGRVTTNGTRFNIKYGLHIDTRLGSNPNYYFSTGLFVLNTGGTLTHDYFREIPGTNGSIQATERTAAYRFNYVNIPVTMMLRTNEIGYLTYFARVGFDAGFNIKATADFEDKFDGEVITTEDEDASDFAGLFRAGLHIEGGIEYNFSGNSRFVISLEWNNGLNNIFDSDYKLPVFDSDGDLIIEDGSVKTDRRVKGSNNSIMLNLGIYF